MIGERTLFKHLNRMMAIMLTLLIGACSSAGGIQTPANDASASHEDSKKSMERQCLPLEIKGSQISYNGRRLVLGGTIEEWISILGKNYRASKGNPHSSYTWDGIGIYLFETKGFAINFTVQISPREESQDHLFTTRPDGSPAVKVPNNRPINTFCGKLLIDGADINSESTIATINSKKQGNKFHKAYLPDLFSGVTPSPENFYLKIDTNGPGIFSSIHSFVMYKPSY